MKLTGIFNLNSGEVTANGDPLQSYPDDICEIVICTGSGRVYNYALTDKGLSLTEHHEAAVEQQTGWFGRIIQTVRAQFHTERDFI